MNLIRSDSITLSNNIVRAYIKKDKKRISFHYDFHVIVKTETYFDSECLKKVKCSFSLFSGKKIELTTKQWVVSETNYDYSFKGHKAINIHLQSIIDFRKIVECVIELELDFVFEIQGQESKVSITNVGLLKKMYDERRFE